MGFISRPIPGVRVRKPVPVIEDEETDDGKQSGGAPPPPDESPLLSSLDDFPVRDALVAYFGDKATVSFVHAHSDERLLAIPTIGPKTLEAIRAYKLPAPTEETSDEGSGDGPQSPDGSPSTLTPPVDTPGAEKTESGKQLPPANPMTEPLPKDFPAWLTLTGEYGETVTAEEVSKKSDEALTALKGIKDGLLKQIRAAVETLSSPKSE